MWSPTTKIQSKRVIHFGRLSYYGTSLFLYIHVVLLLSQVFAELVVQPKVQLQAQQRCASYNKNPMEHMLRTCCDRVALPSQQSSSCGWTRVGQTSAQFEKHTSTPHKVCRY